MNTKTLLTRIGVPVLGLGLLGGAAAATAAPAHAWAWNPNVTVTGKLTSCGAPGPIQSESVRANLNGQIATWSTPGTSANPTYSLHWSNVPNGNGGYAFYVIHCSGPTPDHSGWMHVWQPVVGGTLGGPDI